ncbi:MAG: hypothetical protein HRT38_19840 [Alteromonadaceae bacterium]|nr:hypothetical protein [Alteromonadaceae bacterium]
MTDKNKAQETLMEIKILLNTDNVREANKLLELGCILINTTESEKEGRSQETRKYYNYKNIEYTLGFKGEKSELPIWATATNEYYEDSED